MSQTAMRLEALRAAMRRHGMDAWLAPTNDFHGSEYIGDHFKARQFLTGFTGSVGTLLVTMEDAWLWVDGRYFVQAEKQLAGKPVRLQKSGQPGVPTVEAFLRQIMARGQVLGMDGRVISAAEGMELQQALTEAGAAMCTCRDIVDEVWTERPAMSMTPAYFLTEAFLGESRRTRLERVRRAMAEQGAKAHLLTSLDDIAWLYLMRGSDIHCSPVVQAYSLITMDKAVLYVQPGALSEEQQAELLADGIHTAPYGRIEEDLDSLTVGPVLLDLEIVSFQLQRSLPETLEQIQGRNPTLEMKIVKTPEEMVHIRHAHLKDGTAMTRLLYWIKHSVGREPVTEVGIGKKLEALRKEQEGYLGPSFETIAAYADNAAMCHYVATPESDRTVEPRGLLLVDAGGQYSDGTTDTTRTIAVGEITEQERLHYTLALKGMIGLSKIRFRQGYSGWNLDFAARGPLWEHGLDYNHGTGHGVGFMLNVHEPGNFIHWRLPEHMRTVYREGMLVSNEPGCYVAGSHGVRHENLLLCHREPSEETVPFLYFETVTLCPIDTAAIDLSYLDLDEKRWLNAYHRSVYERIGPRLSARERAWLREMTAEIE